ncbi:MAG: CBS domain-containing protein [Rhodospirillales bacterium]
MNVGSILQSKGTRVVTVKRRTTIEAIVHLFHEKGIGAVVVTDDDTNVLGIVSERDIVVGLSAYGANLLNMRALQVMHQGHVACTPTDSVKTIMSWMTTRRVRHLAVVVNGALCGIISIGDVVKKQLTDLRMEVNVLREVTTIGRART